MAPIRQRTLDAKRSLIPIPTEAAFEVSSKNDITPKSITGMSESSSEKTFGHFFFEKLIATQMAAIAMTVMEIFEVSSAHPLRNVVEPITEKGRNVDTTVKTNPAPEINVDFFILLFV